ncbi:MAG: hypothetical protein K1X53_17750 [Candidatus Sumerlaeaceae bacterium]|nr:hypothetical protein [Candidatus Sumerlaeaceae bacterium]
MNKKGIIIVSAVVLVVVGAFVLGFADSESAIGKIRYIFFAAKGEVANLGAKAPSNTPQLAAQCKENLKRIQRGKVGAGEKRGNNIGGVTWEEVCTAMFPTEVQLKSNPARLEQMKPKCPCGGTYQLGTMQEMPKCSIGATQGSSSELTHAIAGI